MDLSSRPSSPTKSVRVKSSVSSSVRSPPNKPSRAPVRSSKLSPPTAHRVITRPQISTSNPPSPEPSRLRSLTNTGPVPLHHALSFSSFQPSPKVNDASPTIRVTSKVSGVAKSVHPNNPTDNPPPQAIRHTRTGSGSSTPTVSPTVLYPITTAAPAANPHRYAPARPPLRKAMAPFSTVKADPLVPPPSPPPVSSVSISSHSSISYSKADGSFTQQDISSSSPEHSPITLRPAFLPKRLHERHSSSESLHDNDDNDDNDEHKVKAAAKSNRKIADLEITNKSLMAINASLEATKHKQAKEIRDLRRKLRESRLILPPRAYLAIKSSLGDDDTADEDEDGEGDEEGEEGAREETDQAFVRIKTMLDKMLEAGKRALETKVSDFGGAGSAAKVLSAEEVRSWRRDSVGDEEAEPDEAVWRPSISPSRIAAPDSSDDEPPSLDGVTIEHGLYPSSPPPPPIFVTPSH